jgi:hypothetical protein
LRLKGIGVLCSRFKRGFTLKVLPEGIKGVR